MKNNKYKLIIRAQNLEEEFDYLWWVIKDLSFYKKNDYVVVLPKHKLFLDLIKENKLDKRKIHKLFKEEIYNLSYFKLGIEKLEKNRLIFDKVNKIFEKMCKKWGLILFEEYDVLLTAYGPGGSYTPLGNKAKILILTTADGQFKINPIETIIHEMVHLGIEKNIVEKFKLEHWEKETLVDSICFFKFRELIPNYKYQNYGNTKIKDYINNETVENIPNIVEKYVNDYPR